MNLDRVRRADWITGGCGLALLVLLWAPWYGLQDGSSNAWQALALTDLWLVLLAVLAMGVPVSTAAREAPAIPVAVGVWCGLVALIAVPLMLWRLVDLPGDAFTGREWGLWLAAAAVLGAFAASWHAMRDESAPGVRPHPEIAVMQAPPPGAGPEPARQET